MSSTFDRVTLETDIFYPYNIFEVDFHRWTFRVSSEPKAEFYFFLDLEVEEVSCLEFGAKFFDLFLNI